MVTKLRFLGAGLMVVGCMVFVPASLCWADYSQSVVVSPYSALTVVRNDPDAVPGTFLRIENPDVMTSWQGQVSWLDGPALQSGQTVEGGYQLLDTTLVIQWNNPWQLDGSHPWPVYTRGIGYKRRALTRQGITEASLQIMRLAPGGTDTVWRRGVRQIRQVARLRRCVGGADNVLGHYGVDLANQYAWAVVDQPGSYALAGSPEPGTLALLGCGLFIAGRQWVRRRAEKRRA